MSLTDSLSPHPASTKPEASEEPRTATGGPSEAERDQWSKLQKRVKRSNEKLPALKVFGNSAARGRVYRWGLTTGCQGCGDGPDIYPPIVLALSRMATGEKIGRKLDQRIDFSLAAELLCDQKIGPELSASDAAMILTWAAAMPKLSERLPTRIWWDTLGKLQQVAEQHRNADRTDSPLRLMLGGELGLTLAWRLRDLPSCRRLRDASVPVVQDWFAAEADSIASAVTGIHDSRIVLGSVLRCNFLLDFTTKRSLTKRQRAIAADLATWVAGFAHPGGGSAMDDPALLDSKRNPFADDVGSTKKDLKFGLFGQAAALDPETLKPAIDAALGKSQTGGRLAWQVSLPESLIHCDKAKVAVMMPEWDVRRGRTIIDYGKPDCQIEVHSRRRKVIAGTWQIMIAADGEEQFAQSHWECTCEFTDDDVHYLELEQAWSGDLVVQRHLLLLREDRSLLVADSVMPASDEETPNDGMSSRHLSYTSRLPLGRAIASQEESETREIWLNTKPDRKSNKKKKRDKSGKPSYSGDVLAIPLSAGEWRVGPTMAELHSSDDGHLVLAAQGENRLFAPLWFDFVPRRLKRKRTWRRLTIADELSIVPPDHAVAYRLQMGSEHWVLYRSLEGSRVRSMLGKHLIADFFAGHFHPEDGDIEELVTVEAEQDE